MNNKNRVLQSLIDYVLLTAGTFLIALAVRMYLIPCHIVTGSVSGLALLLSQVVSLNDSLIVLIMNVFCLFVGILYLGRRFGLRCFYVSLLLPLLIEILPDNKIFLSGNILVNIFMFLMLLTAGQCILFGLDASSGGLDTIAEVLAVKMKTSTGLMVALSGLAVSALTIAVYDLNTAVMGALVTLANGLMINAFSFIYHLFAREHETAERAHA